MFRNMAVFSLLTIIAFQAKASFYIQAHQDEWQLFMGAQALAEMRANGHAVLVFLTAGDAGAPAAWWMQRELATRQSVELGVRMPNTWVTGTATYNNHTIPKYKYGNVTCYFLRLPDGSSDGGGFSSNSYQSLEKLRNGQGSVTSVDGRGDTYATWSDLTNTLGTLFMDESTFIAGDVLYNFVGSDTSYYPGHSDVINTAYAMDAALLRSMVTLAFRGQAQYTVLYQGAWRTWTITQSDLGQTRWIPQDSGAQARSMLLEVYDFVMMQAYDTDGPTLCQEAGPSRFGQVLGLQPAPVTGKFVSGDLRAALVASILF